MKKQKEKKTRKLWKKMCLGLVGVLVLLLCIPVACYGIVHIGAGGKTANVDRIDALSERDVAIVPCTSAEGVITEKGLERIQAAMQLYQSGRVKRIVVSGEKTETITMARYMMKRGIPKDALLCDSKGVDTYDTLARAKEKLGDVSYYFCTQSLYRHRAGYLMMRLGIDGKVVCVDTMYYGHWWKNQSREFLAATKAVFEPVLEKKQPKTSLHKTAFIQVEPLQENPHYIYPEEVTLPEDAQCRDANLQDDYQVAEAVKYARTYALERNPEYGQFESNCTNFVSQCLVAGGLPMEGIPKNHTRRKWDITHKETQWYNVIQKDAISGETRYRVSQSFVNTEAFITYITEQKGYTLSMYDNDASGNEQCLKELATGDILILYKKDGSIAHLGLISGISEKDAFYCGNTANRRDVSVFMASSDKYSKIGIVHMSQQK